MGDLFLNDKLLNFVTIIFFASIIINGFLLMISATPSGAWITGTNLTNDNLNYSSLGGQNIDTTEGFISNTSQSQDASSFNPFSIDGVLAGVNAFNFLIAGLFLIEMVFVRFATWFPLFAPLFLGIAGILLGAKILLIGYFGSVLLSAILGRR